MAAGDLTDIDTLKVWLGLSAGTGPSDALLSQLVTAASAFIVDYLGRDLVVTSYTDIYDGNGAAFMLLRQAPITAVQSVAFCGKTITAAADPVAETAGILFDDRRLSLIGECFPHRAPVVVAYTAGYAAIPPAIVQAALEIAGEAFRRRERIGLTSKGLGGQETIAFSSADMNATVRAALEPYRAVAPV
jgi:hypothetical protein